MRTINNECWCVAKDGTTMPLAGLSVIATATCYSLFKDLKVGSLHPVACTRSGSGFPSNATLV
jgi:hypothetical protein